jgi:hypothetical protein
VMILRPIKSIPQVPSAPGWLAAHSAIYLELQRDLVF